MGTAKEILERELPKRFASEPKLARKVLGTFHLELAPAGSWTVTMNGLATVRKGAPAGGAFRMRLTEGDFVALMADPTRSWELFSQGRIDSSHPLMSAQLLEALFPGALRKGMGEQFESFFPAPGGASR